MKTSIRFVILAACLALSTQASADSSYQYSVHGSDADVHCSIDRASGRVFLGINLDRSILRSAELIDNAILITEVGQEAWNDPTFNRRICAQLMRELRSRERISGRLQFSKRESCFCESRSPDDCYSVVTEAIGFFPLKPDGKTYYSFQSSASRSVRDPSCFHDPL
jgi:hypothetical protein